MKITTTYVTEFSGSHTVAKHPVCGQLHGHVWNVRIEIAGNDAELDANAIRNIGHIIAEYHRKDLDRYLPGVETTNAGLAAYFRELLSEYPITMIEVTTDDGVGARLDWLAR